MIVEIKKGASKEEIREKINKMTSKKQNDLMKYAGKLKLNIDPLTYQKKMRDEWK